MAWSVCGIIVFVNYFRLTDENAKLFIIVYLSFWAYFEYNITRAFIWKKFGKEKLWIQDGVMYYQKEVNKKGKISQFNLELVDKVKMLELSNTSLADTVNQSFWVRGGERLEFQSQAKVQRFGLQINDEEARIILNEINSYIS
jgi:hypothetical protein